MREEKNTEKFENLLESDFIKFDVLIWYCDDEGEGPAVIDTINALTEVHARIILRNGIHYTKKYPKGAWLDYILDGKRIELDIAGRIA
jgi:hypothetical protein